jgi:alkanesulfonate monooxygenase SsuD/methylene tetrahydromethanopterin reductase-like flavin-dependent oxidoreductase (luciferase family)
VIAIHCDDVGRDFDEIVKSTVWGIAIADTDEEALKVAKSTPHSLKNGLIGSPEALVSKIGEFIDAGVEYFQLYFPLMTDAEATQKFAEEVIPEL